MIDYVEREDACRSRILLTYFDERKTKNCGICDFCLQKNKTGLTNYEFEEIKEQLLSCFSSTHSFRLNELVDSLKHSTTDSDKVVTVVRTLIQKEVLDLENDTITLCNKN